MAAHTPANGDPLSPDSVPTVFTPVDLFDQVGAAEALVHLRAFQDFADRHRGTRLTASAGYEASVDYVSGVLGGAGFEVAVSTYQLKLKGQGLHGKLDVRQVIGQTRTGDPNRVVVLGAHLDSVKSGPGIDDNGSSCAALLEIARAMGASPPVHNAVRFGFWGAEEENNAGSLAYVRGLSPAERDKILLYVNADMIASANGGYFVQGMARSAPPGSARVARVLIEQLRRGGIEPDLYKFDGESDYEGFVDAGISCAGVLTSGAKDNLTKKQAAKWGGRAGGDIAPYYHSRGDTLAHIDYTIFEHFTRALAGTTSYFSMLVGDLSC